MYNNLKSRKQYEKNNQTAPLENEMFKFAICILHVKYLVK